MNQPFNGSGKTFLEVFKQECLEYIEACSELSDQAVASNQRGDHFFMVTGIDRQNKEVSNLFKCFLKTAQ